MSLIDKARQHIQTAADAAQHAAESALEAGHTLSAQAQSQVAMRKLQIEQARKTHELGKETYAWHQSGAMVVNGPVPRNVQMLCFQIDDLNEKIEAETLRLEEIKRMAALRAQQNVVPDDSALAAPDVWPAPDATSASTPAPSSPPQLSGNAPTRPLPPDDSIS